MDTRVSLCYLCVLCVSVVAFYLRIYRPQRHREHRDSTEKNFRPGHHCRHCSFLLCLCASVVILPACAQQMGHQPHVWPLQPNTHFADRQSARPSVPGTISSGYTRTNHRVEKNSGFDPNANSLPFPLTQEILERGRERYNIYCSVCHSENGDGYGEVVHRGFKKPASFFEDRLQQAPLGYFYDVITNGYGAMASNAMQVEPKDRWAIAAYIRMLQSSHNAGIENVSTKKRQLESAGAPH
jgi:Cytochrome C oxidase, cbb3-type, subunit III